MAKVIITLKVNLESPQTNIEKVKAKVTEMITSFDGDVGKIEIEEVAFGLKALKFVFILDESKGGTESLESDIEVLEEVSSVEVTDVRRAVG